MIYEYLIAIREWTAWIMEFVIMVYVVWEFYYDAAIEEKKHQKRTKTSKKTTKKDGDVIEESTEILESTGEKTEEKNEKNSN